MQFGNKKPRFFAKELFTDEDEQSLLQVPWSSVSRHLTTLSFHTYRKIVTQVQMFQQIKLFCSYWIDLECIVNLTAPAFVSDI